MYSVNPWEDEPMDGSPGAETPSGCAGTTKGGEPRSPDRETKPLGRWTTTFECSREEPQSWCLSAAPMTSAAPRKLSSSCAGPDASRPTGPRGSDIR